VDHQVTEIVDDLRFIQERFFSRSTAELVGLADRIANVFRDGGRLYVFGTGPSNLIARILVDALVHKIAVKRPPMAALALGTDAALMSGIGEQSDLSQVLARELTSLGSKGDMALAFSVDGESPATIKALVAAREAGLPTAAFLGRDGGPMRNYVDQALVVEAEHPARIHEVHLVAAQILAQLIERQLFPL
jgi:D-sedoheptulose 7-phosphate isomerase